LNLLEELRRLPDPPFLLFTSTNKVYGSLRNVELSQNGARWEPVDRNTLEFGVDERQQLEFLSPYGCSKGAADQYVLDYAAHFGLPAVVFRMSCIYGPHQFGVEDQGWLAHFVIRSLDAQPITIFGDGKQSRDVLYVEDLVDAMLLARTRMDDIAGHVFNIGGGPGKSISPLELLRMIGERIRGMPEVRYAESRPGDQRYYASDIRGIRAATGWNPKTAVKEGVGNLYDWVIEARQPAIQVHGGGA